MNKHLILIPIGLTLSLGGLALAQSVPDGIDLDKVRERAAEHTEEAQALATNVRERAEALTEDAQGVQVQAQANRASYADRITVTGTDAVLDFDAMIGTAPTFRTALAQAAKAAVIWPFSPSIWAKFRT